MKPTFLIAGIALLTTATACEPTDPAAGSVTDRIEDAGVATIGEGRNDGFADSGDASQDAVDSSDSDDAGNPAERFKPPKTDEVSDVSVTFQLHNPTDEPIYVGIEGTYCQAWGIDGLELVEWYECLCECGAPESSDVLSEAIVAPGETYELLWDGRSVGRSLETLECWAGELVDFWRPYWKVAPEGNYTFFVSVFDEVPTQNGSPGDPDAIAWDKAGVCSVVDRVASASFDLPASGSLTVAVDLSLSEPASSSGASQSF